MRLRLITVTHRVPAWVRAGFDEYAKRLPLSCELVLAEVPAVSRAAKGTSAAVREAEGERILRALSKDAWVVVLDERGEPWTTAELARRLAGWLRDAREMALVVGGAEGLDPRCLERADERWSLSPLTLPHALVRVIVAEQIYRAFSILSRHPYHRP